jgi:hypothetical protein
MSLSILDLKSIASKGGGMVLDATKISVLDLKSIASKASETQAQIIIKKPQILSVLDMKSIASKGNGCIIFDFYES